MKEYKILVIDDEPEIVNSNIEIMEQESTKYTFYQVLKEAFS